MEALITGTLTPFTDSVRIGIKILDVSTGEIIDASSGNLQKTIVIFGGLGGVGFTINSGTSPSPADSQRMKSDSILSMLKKHRQALENRLLIVSHTEQGNTIRIISSRVANNAERSIYEQG